MDWPDEPAKEISAEIEALCDHRVCQGWQNALRNKHLAQLILWKKPSVVVEVGVFAGRSFLSQALALKQNGAGVIYGIDPYDASIIHEWQINQEEIERARLQAVDGIHRHSLQKHAVLVQATSAVAASLFESIDVLHIDGCHDEENSCFDVATYGPKVRSGGWIWFDDSNYASTQKAVTLLDGMARLENDQWAYRLYRKT